MKVRIPFSVAIGVGLVWLIVYLFISFADVSLGYTVSLAFMTMGVTAIILLLFSGEKEKLKEK